MSDSAETRAVFRDESSVELADGTVLSITDAIDRLPWVTAYCPTMPHQYVVSSWSDCDPVALAAILTMIRDSSRVVPAYWRGYRTPTRYWHGPGGFRYWISAGIFPERGDTVLNRTDAPDDTRPVADRRQARHRLGRRAVGSARAGRLRVGAGPKGLVAVRQCHPRRLPSLPRLSAPTVDAGGEADPGRRLRTALSWKMSCMGGQTPDSDQRFDRPAPASRRPVAAVAALGGRWTWSSRSGARTMRSQLVRPADCARQAPAPTVMGDPAEHRRDQVVGKPPPASAPTSGPADRRRGRGSQRGEAPGPGGGG